MNPQSKKEIIVNTAWIFDVDGVIVDPQEKLITDHRILDQIISKMKLREPVALNTGRSLAWMIDRVINPLFNRTDEKAIFSNLFASGEKGSVWAVFDNKGKVSRHKDNTISIPRILQDEVKELIDMEFSESMFFDKTKETMISIEMKDGYSIEEFSKQQEILKQKLKDFVAKYDPSELLKIDPTTVATDIENIHVNKGFAVERILRWLDEKCIVPLKFVTMGDSYSDFSMPEKLNDLGKRVDFVYVGKNPINQFYPFPVIRPENPFTKGAVEALESYKE